MSNISFQYAKFSVNAFQSLIRHLFNQIYWSNITCKPVNGSFDASRQRYHNLLGKWLAHTEPNIWVFSTQWEWSSRVIKLIQCALRKHNFVWHLNKIHLFIIQANQKAKGYSHVCAQHLSTKTQCSTPDHCFHDCSRRTCSSELAMSFYPFACKSCGLHKWIYSSSTQMQITLLQRSL